MPQFRFFLIDESDRVERFEAHESAGESVALSRGREVLLANPRAAALEIWQSGRFVARLQARRGRERT
jgi:hypothetical protein